MSKLNSAIYYIVLFAGAIGVLFWVASPEGVSNSTENSAPAIGLAADEKLFDFGTISMAAGIVTHEFKIKNISANDAVIEQIYTSCMCTRASFIKGDVKLGPFGMPGHGLVPRINGTVSLGEDAVIKVEFDPAAHGPAGVGPVDRSVYVFQKNNDKPIEIKFKAVVTP